MPLESAGFLAMYAWILAVVSVVAFGQVMRRQTPDLVELLCMSLAALVIGLACGVGTSLWVAERLRLVIVAPVCIAAMTAIAWAARALSERCDTPRPHPGVYGSSFSSKAVLLIMLAVAIFGFGRQFEYASAWGDIGSYIVAGQHYLRGGTLPFEFHSRALILSSAGSEHLHAPVGVIQPALKHGQYIFHALPGWPGLMALFALPNAGTSLLSILFGLSVGLFFFIARSLIGKDRPALLGTVLLATLPVAWFLSLYATAEMFTMTIVVSSLLLTLRARCNPVVVGLAAFAYGTVHISLFLVTPLLGGVLLLAGITCEAGLRPRIALAGVLASIGSVLAGLFGFAVSHRYSADIAQGLIHGQDWLLWAAYCLPLLGALPWALAKAGPGGMGAVQTIVDSVRRRAGMLGIAIVIVVIAAALVEAYLLGWTLHYYPASMSPLNSGSAMAAVVDKGLPSVAHLSMLSLAGATGVLGLLAFMILPFTWQKDDAPRHTELVVWLACAYLVIVYGLMHPIVTNNYYMSRYYLPVVTPLSLLAAVFLFRKWRVMRLAVVLIALGSGVFISILVGSGFFIGDKAFVQQVIARVGTAGNVYIDGSTWLQYLFSPALSDYGTADAAENRKPVGSGDQARLITDRQAIVGGISECLDYAQRRIPWQISYPLAPDVHNHRVCVVTANAVPSAIFNYSANHWLVDGATEFTLVAPSGGGKVEIDVESGGWWAGKPPFVADMAALHPRLHVCGTPFQVEEISPRRIRFVGTMAAPFCLAKLTTATFVPSLIGQGTDVRKLGVDLHAIAVRRIDRSD